MTDNTLDKLKGLVKTQGKDCICDVEIEDCYSPVRCELYDICYDEDKGVSEEKSYSDSYRMARKLLLKHTLTSIK